MGGGSGPSNQQVTQTNIPEYARPYFERLMSRTEASSNEPYQAYTGQRVEGLNSVQTGAINGIAGMQPNFAVAHAANMGRTAGEGMLGNTGYQAGHIGSTYDPRATTMFAAPERVNSTYQGGEFSGADADKYMSPYQQRVIDIAKREAVRQGAIGDVGRDMKAARAGAFGGSRAALVKQESQRNLNQQLDDIQAKGSQAAYENAQAQYERDRAARADAARMGLGASQFNSQQQMAYGQAGQQNQQFNEQARQRAAELGLQGQTANEQAQAAAAGLRNNAWTNYGNMATGLANIGRTQQDMDMQRYTGALQAGDKLQQTNQSALDAAYDNFVNQRDYDRQMLNFYGGILRGVPVSANSDVRVSQASNPLSQIAGLGVAGLGAYNAYKGS